MIILDACILRGSGLNSSSTDVLRAIRTAGVEGVAVPWMVMEELSAQQAIKYRKQYEAAAQAIESLGKLTPWGLGYPMPDMDLDRLREHWRKQWSSVVDVIPTSEAALREGAFREANGLAPCRDDGRKTGARDAAIWLSAVEYAKEHADQTVYFVSDNTRDFGDGTSYADPMRTDIAELGERFVHLTGLGEVIDRFTESTTVEQDVIQRAVESEAALSAISRLAHTLGGGRKSTAWLQAIGGSAFPCKVADENQEPIHVSADGWLHDALRTRPTTISDVESYRVGDHVWCTATVRWLVYGTALFGSFPKMAACAFEARVLFAPDNDDPRLTVLRHSPFEPATDAEFTELKPVLTWNFLLSADELRARTGVDQATLAKIVADGDTKLWMRVLAATTMLTTGLSKPLSAISDIHMGETHEG
ncbi:PIN domain-containing protein [Streptomyces griseofuscus]|uniref:PIN domain-containing protein n=1 Tax=Streptomyces griseofuscus TaxID=146922 RepID=UPI0033E153F7